VGKKVHFWPFDGWEIPDKQSVIVEVYPNVAEISGRKSLNNLQHSLLEVFPCTEC
jgi:hypothetical protein